MEDRILVGSNAFFGNMPDFRKHDTDFVVFVDADGSFDWRKELSMRGVCTFTYVREPIGVMIQKTLESGDALLVGKFLVPEVAQVLGATVADVLPLEVLLEGLDDKHAYIGEIFSAVKANGSFELTPEQLAQAYEVYKSARPRYAKVVTPEPWTPYTSDYKPRYTCDETGQKVEIQAPESPDEHEPEE